MIREKLTGVGVAMITPFTSDGRVDYQALARMIDYVIEGGVDYIVALGTTAETPTLYMPERAVIAMFITNHIAGRVPLVMGCGGNSTSEVLDQLRDGRAQPREQDESRVTYAAKLAKEDGYIDWARPAAEVHARIRGVTPWPGARLQARFDGQDELLPLLLQPGRVDEPCDGVQPGSLRTDKKGLCVACADRWYRLLVVRPQGRKDMEAAAFVNGHLRPAQHGVCGMAVPFGE